MQPVALEGVRTARRSHFPGECTSEMGGYHNEKRIRDPISPPPPPGDGGGTQNGEGPADGGTRRPVGGGGGLTGKRQRERVGEAAEEAAPLVQCVLGEVNIW